MKDLDRRLILAHAADDRTMLVKLYTEAADRTEDTDAACYYLTHAYVHALELGHPGAASLRARLAAAGREIPDDQAALTVVGSFGSDS